MKFSERMGLKEVRTVIQRDGMSVELRNSLWNILYRAFWGSRSFHEQSDGVLPIDNLNDSIWEDYLKLPIESTLRRTEEVSKDIRSHYFSCPWYEVYDFIEFVLGNTKRPPYEVLAKKLNLALKRELAGYRVLEAQIVPITEDIEIEAVAQAISESPFSGARIHLGQALKHLSNRETPNYRNSIKESISAVESTAQEITGDPKVTLGKALKRLDQSGGLHGSLREAFEKLYGYTSDADGIRHALQEEPNLTLADAKYFLVACSAFVNYLVEKYAEFKPASQIGSR